MNDTDLIVEEIERTDPKIRQIKFQLLEDEMTYSVCTNP